jgi:cytochrome c oxidase subunit IV
MMSHHVLPLKTYFLVFAALLVLLALTVAAAEIENNVVNLVVGLTIAVTKAVLIVLFFMHVRYNSFVIRVAVVSGFLWLGILITFTMSDYLTRETTQENMPSSEL